MPKKKRNIQVSLRRPDDEQDVGGYTGALQQRGGYAKWATPNTSTQAYDPAQQITRAKDADRGIAPSVSTPAPTPPAEQTNASSNAKEQTITDGDTDVVVNVLNKPETAPLGTNLKQESQRTWKDNPPCINPQCKSRGKPHPNCLCYGVGGSNVHEAWFAASGGMVGERFCSKNQAHNPKCEYYMADGGEIGQDGQPSITPPDNTETTVGHVAAEHGLLGLLKDVGHRRLKDHEKHTQTLTNHYDPEKIIGSPLTGTISPSRLDTIMQRLGPMVSSKEPSADAFRNSVDYLSAAMRGHNSLDSNVGSLFGNEPLSDDLEPEHEDREALKQHLEKIRENPSLALEIGGTLGHYLPDHNAQLAAHSAQAMNYLESLRPQQMPSGPLGPVSQQDPLKEQKYNRALDIANKPLMVLHHAKEGTLQHQDVKTLMALYPGLHKSMVKKIGEALIEAKMNNTEIPHHQRMSVSMLIGQPLDSSFTPQSMQAIIRANAGAQMPQTQNKQAKPKKASGVELKQINQVNQMGETPNQARISDKKE